MKVKHSIQAAIEELKLPKLRKFQIEPINSILDHRDTMAIAPTGSGKSAIFQIPAIIKGKRGKWTLVVEPTLALIVNQVNDLQKQGIAAEMMTSRNKNEHDNILNKLYNRELTILYVTPEQLRTYAFLSTPTRKCRFSPE